MSISTEVQDDATNKPLPLQPAGVKAAEKVLAEVVDVPTSPPVAFKLLSMLKKQSQHNEEMVEVIKFDANLTASVLKVCNSSMYAGSGSINSVEDAIIRLGYARLTEMVVTISLGKVYTKSKHENCYNPYDLWRKCVKSSLAAKTLAPLCEDFHVDPNLAFTMGILHDMGKFALNNCPIPEMGEIASLIETEEMEDYEAELEMLGTDHAVVGAILLEDWNLSQEIVEAVRYHIYPEYSPSPMASLCHVAGVSADTGGDNEVEVAKEKFYEKVNEKALEILGLGEEAVDHVFQKMEKDSNSVQTFMMVA